MENRITSYNVCYTKLLRTQAWQALQAHFAANKDRQIKDLFAADPARFDKFTTTFGGDILVDYSKNLITDETLSLLLDRNNFV